MGFLNRLFSRERQTGSDQLERTLSLCTVHAGSLVATVGESYRQEALRAVAGVVTDAGPFLADLCDYALEVAQTEPERRWFRAELIPEPDNAQDPNAIAVYAEEGEHVAYLSREHASAYRQVFASLSKRGYGGATCPAVLTGGGGKSYGVVIALSSPGHVLGDLHARSTLQTARSGRVQRTSGDGRSTRPLSQVRRGKRLQPRMTTRPRAAPTEQPAPTRSATGSSFHGAPLAGATEPTASFGEARRLEEHPLPLEEGRFDSRHDRPSGATTT